MFHQIFVITPAQSYSCTSFRSLDARCEITTLGDSLGTSDLLQHFRFEILKMYLSYERG